MKNLVILGAGTGGTMVANHLRKRLAADWSVSVVDPEPRHLYQPGLLFLPFGKADEKHLERPRGRTLGAPVRWIESAVAGLDAAKRKVALADGGELDYDILVVATGSSIHPEETEGLVGDHYGETVHDFYTLTGAVQLRAALDRFAGGKLVVNIVEMPIKCPVAPLEFLFLADEYFSRRGIRDRVELVFATPFDGAFTKPMASKKLGYMLEKKGIRVEAEFNTGSVDADDRVLRSWDEREVPYDLLVSVPTHMGAGFLEEAGLGNELNFVPTDAHTLKAQEHDDIFVIGDATDLAASKAGSVAHFECEVVAGNIQRTIRGEDLEAGFDGHSNCFIESGYGKAVLIDFNYDVEPLPGRYPLPFLGPLTLLEETRLNHWGKKAFQWIYWNALLPALPMPVSNRMSMRGKRQPEPALRASA